MSERTRAETTPPAYAGPMRRAVLVSSVVLLASSCAGPSSPQRPAPVSAASRAASSSGVTKPHVVWKPIPFGPRRKREMAAYSKRHYGTWDWRLVHPHVVVEHY